MKSILAFGDSNTWGLIPGSHPHVRYSDEVRWTCLLQKKQKDIRVIEEGLCGRTTVFEDPIRKGRKGIELLPVLLESHWPIDAVILMLGTNDCKSIYGASAEVIGKGIELCLNELEIYTDPSRIILVSPVSLGDDVWKPEKDPEFNTKSVIISRELKAVYAQIAKRRGVHFIAASDYVTADEKDDEHFNEKGHALFADALYEKLKEMDVV